MGILAAILANAGKIAFNVAGVVGRFIECGGQQADDAGVVIHKARFDGLTPEREGRLSNDPDILRGELAAIGLAEADGAIRLQQPEFKQKFAALERQLGR